MTGTSCQHPCGWPWIAAGDGLPGWVGLYRLAATAAGPRVWRSWRCGARVHRRVKHPCQWSTARVVGLGCSAQRILE